MFSNFISADSRASLLESKSQSELNRLYFSSAVCMQDCELASISKHDLIKFLPSDVTRLVLSEYSQRLA